MDIYNNNDNRDEERRIEQRRQQSRTDAERRHKAEPMRTFEAKLSEKASHEAALKESQAKQSNQLKKNRKDKEESLLNKILDVAGKESKEKVDPAKVHELEQQYDPETGEEETKLEKELNLSEEKNKTDEKKAGKEVDKKSSEYSEEGHRRVAEKESEGQSQGGMGGDSGGYDQDSGTGSSFSQSGSGSGQERQPSDKTSLKEFMVKNKVAGLSSLGAREQRGFKNSARNFTTENLDEIVKNVEVGFNEQGEEFFGITLSDPYFKDLQVQSLRTEQGIVVKFLCPNIEVRSTFIKYRPRLYAHFKTKNISVFRIDVV